MQSEWLVITAKHLTGDKVRRPRGVTLCSRYTMHEAGNVSAPAAKMYPLRTTMILVGPCTRWITGSLTGKHQTPLDSNVPAMVNRNVPAKKR